MYRPAPAAAFAVASLLILSPLEASAQPTQRQRILLLAPSSQVATSKQIHRSLRAAPIDFIYPSSPDNLEGSHRAFKTAQRLLEKAGRLYDELQFSKALAVLQQAKRDANLVTLREIYFKEALIQQTLKHSSAARKALESYVQLGGSPPSTTYYPPEVISLYRAAKKGTAVRPVAPLVIQFPNLVSEDFSIYLNGEKFSGVREFHEHRPTGTYYLTVTASSYETHDELFTLPEAGKTLSISLSPDSVATLSKKLMNNSELIQTNEVGKLIQSRTQTQGIVRISTDSIDLLREGEKVWSRTIQTVGDVNDELVRNLRAAILGEAGWKQQRLEESLWVTSDLNPPPNPNLVSRAPATLTASPPEWYRKWWVWTLVGTVAAGAGGAFFLMNSQGSGSDSIALTVRSRIAP